MKLNENAVLIRCKGIQSIQEAKKLNCWGLDLDDISLFEQMPNLEVLALSKNAVTSLKSLSNCLKLRELYLRENNISDLSELVHLQKLSDLKTLWLSENPVAKHEDYRWTVVRLLPHIKNLDNEAVTADEINAAVNGPAPSQLKLMQTSTEVPEVSNPVAESNNLEVDVDPRRAPNVDQRDQSPGPQQQVPVKRPPTQHSPVVRSNTSNQQEGFSWSYGNEQGDNNRVPSEHMDTSTEGIVRGTPPQSTSTEWVGNVIDGGRLVRWPSNGRFVREGTESTGVPRVLPTASGSSPNVLAAVIALLDDLDKEGLHLVMAECHARLANVSAAFENTLPLLQQ